MFSIDDTLYIPASIENPDYSHRDTHMLNSRFSSASTSSTVYDFPVCMDFMPFLISASNCSRVISPIAVGFLDGRRSSKGIPLFRII